MALHKSTKKTFLLYIVAVAIMVLGGALSMIPALVTVGAFVFLAGLALFVIISINRYIA